MLKTDAMIYDARGNACNLKYKLENHLVQKQAAGMYGNQFSFPEYGNFRPTFYTLGSTEQGLDAMSREYLVRMSRVMFGQLSIVPVASNLKASFVVGNTYLPEYSGNNKEWGKLAEDYLVNIFYPSCCIRGQAFDFQSLLHLLSYLIDEDGDILHVFVKNENGMPQVQFFPSHLIRSVQTGEQITEGKFKGGAVHDGIIYREDGRVLGYQVVEPNSILNTVAKTKHLDTRNARLLFDPRFIDKNRGIPAISPAILQAISCQELYSYLQEKIKLESCVGLIEKNDAGEAPLEYANVLAALNQQQLDYGVFQPSPTVHGVQVIQGPSIRYVKADGGELTTLQSNSPPTQTMDFIRNLETQILSTLGVPHQLVYSPSGISGRIVSGVSEIFCRSISQRQAVLDKYAKLVCGWACSVAMENGLLPPNNDEVMTKVFDFTHPEPFDMDIGYTRAQDLKEYAAGVKSMDDIARKNGRSAEMIMEQREKETTEFLERAKSIAKNTGVAIEIVIPLMRENLQHSPAVQTQGSGDTANYE